MTEVFFYHLERRELERVLPNLLEKSCARGWRAVVQAAGAERIEALDRHLWTYRDDGFLPHGRAEDGHSDLQPVFLTTGEDNPNGAQVRFFIDGADLADLTGYDRCVYLFDGRSEEAVKLARKQWRQAADAGHDVTYWQENENGQWRKVGNDG